MLNEINTLRPTVSPKLAFNYLCVRNTAEGAVQKCIQQGSDLALISTLKQGF